MKRHNLEKKCGRVDMRGIDIDDELDYELETRAFFKEIDLDDWRDEWFADEEEPSDWADFDYDPVAEWTWTEDDDAYFGCPA